MDETPSIRSSPPSPADKQQMRSQIRSLKRAVSESTVSRFPGNPFGVDVMATELALRSSQLVLEATRTHGSAVRALARKGRDVKKLRLAAT